MPTCNCSLFNKNCSEFQHEQREEVVCKDKGPAVYRYKNKNLCPDHLAKYRVEPRKKLPGLIADGMKCDFLLLNCEEQKAFFIELKGADLKKAVRQINAAVARLESELRQSGFAIYARIVLTKASQTDLKDAEYKRLERKMKNLRGDLQQRSGEYIEINEEEKS